MADSAFAFLATSIRERLHPRGGGSPYRMQVWIGITLIVQTLTVFPSRPLLIGAVSLLPGIGFFIRGRQWQIPLSWSYVFVGIGSYLFALISDRSVALYTVMYFNWAIPVWILERRGYIPVEAFLGSVFLLLTLPALCVLAYPGLATAGSTHPVWVAAVGVLLFAINFYLVYRDYLFGRQKMERYVKQLDLINEICDRLAGIVTTNLPLRQSLWRVAAECAPLIGVDDLVIYLYNDRDDRLDQVAAYGPKDGGGQTIVDPIRMVPGVGVVGRTFSERRVYCIDDVREVDDYIYDYMSGLSELCVPIRLRDRTLGVIDSENGQLGFYEDIHRQLFATVATFCGVLVTLDETAERQRRVSLDRVDLIRLREVEELKNAFLTNISHDLRTPLALLVGPAEVIARQVVRPELRQQARYIIQNVRHLESMIEQLLQLNQLNKREPTGRNEDVDLQELIASIHQQYLPAAREQHINFVHQRGEGVSILLTNRFMLSQIIHNLVQNAFQYLGRGSHIAVGWNTREGGGWRVTVEDDGIGIEPGVQERIFDRFFKADENSLGGSGIGLSLVREYAERLDAKVSLRSQPGRGSLFTLDLPARPVQPDAGNDKGGSTSTVDESSPLVLVVEDHADLNRFLTGLISDRGFNVRGVCDLEAARNQLRSNPPDLILTDLMLPGEDGEDWIRELRADDTLDHLPIVVLSARDGEADKQRLYELGIDNFVSKPFRNEALIAVIRNALSRRRKIFAALATRYLYQDLSPDQGRSARDTLVLRALAFVREQLDNPDLVVGDLSQHLGLGRNRLQRELREATGMTPVEFVRSIRLHEGFRLLSDQPELTVSEVAYRTGFNNLSYFSRAFKQQFGHTPSTVAGSTEAPD